MNIRLYNARILTMEENRSIFHGEICIKDDRIIYVGETPMSLLTKGNGFIEETGKEPVWDREIDCQGNLLMPGFKNAHTHSAMTLMRSLADDMPLQDWLEQKIFPLEAKLTADDIYEFARLAILEYVTSGVTAVFDMYLMPDAVAQACLDMGMRCVLVSGLNNFTSSIAQTEDEFLKWNQKPDSLISYRLGCHAEYTCSKELLEQLAGLARKYQAPVYMHMSETAKEVQDCVSRYGMTPPEFMDSLGMFEYGGGIYHGVHLTQTDLRILKDNDICVVTNPASNGKLASGMAPIKEVLHQGITVAMGTDGASSNNCLDMFREMFLTVVYSNLREKDAASINAFDVLKMATVNGSKAMGLQEADVLAVGKLADIILLDLKQPNMQPIHNIENNIVYSGSKSNVMMTMVNGRILYEDGSFCFDVDRDTIYTKCEAIAKRLLHE